MRIKKLASLALLGTMMLGMVSGIATKEVKAAETPNTQERKIIGYFPEWAYGNEEHDNYTADRIPWDKVTHINYAFAVVNPKTNKIDFGDKAAAIEKEFPGQTTDFSYKGHFNVLSSYKKKYPNVKVLISVGGWAGSTGFYTMCETAQGRETFANSCVEFIRQYEFDGVDIDYEYPTSTSGAGNPNDFSVADTKRSKLYADYCEMMKVLREKIDAANLQYKEDYLLTAAIPASSWILGGIGAGEYGQYLDYVNLMTYDFHGAWNGYVGPQSALYPDERDPETNGFPMPVLNIDWAYRYFRGIFPAEKINIGVPYYTRGWKNVVSSKYEGGLYGDAWISRVPGAMKGDGAVGEDNIWHDLDKNGVEEAGGSNPLWHAKNLLKNPDYKYYWDDVTKTPYIWNEKKKVFLTYEDEKSIQAKLDYIVDKNLGGIMIWELDGDYDLGKDGSYGVGDTITTYISDFMKLKGPLVVKEDTTKKLPSANYEVKFTGKYDHPNYDFTMNIKNNTGKEIPGGWKLEFDLPKSAYIQNVYEGSITNKVDNGDFTRYTLVGPNWAPIQSGSSYNITGVIRLCFAGGPRNFNLNGFSSQAEVGQIAPDETFLPEKGLLKSSVTESKDGNYNLTFDIPENSRGEAYKIYEGNNIIKSGIITDNKKQTVTVEMKNKPKGEYNYKAEIINLYGPTATENLKVNVTRVDGGGSESAKLNVDFKVANNWGTGGDWVMKVTNNTGKDISGWEIKFDSNITITSAWSGQFTSLENGSYSIISPSWGGTIKNGETIEIKGACTGKLSEGMIYNVNTTVK